MSLPNQLQHGFLAQDIEKQFPELIEEINMPIIDSEGNSSETFKFKSVNYVGLISVLTQTIKELNEKVDVLESKLNDSKSSRVILEKDILKDELEGLTFSMQQNIPNPFNDRTYINFEFPKDATNTSIVIFDLNGRLIKDYPLSDTKGQLEINANDIGKGMFLYTMMYGDKEIITKKMIIK